MEAGKQSLASGFVQLAISVILLSSAWPLTRIAIDSGSAPVWFAEGRAVISGFLLGASLAWSVAIIVTRATTPRSTMFELLPWCFALSVLMLLPLNLLHAPDGGIGVHQSHGLPWPISV